MSHPSCYRAATTVKLCSLLSARPGVVLLAGLCLVATTATEVRGAARSDAPTDGRQRARVNDNWKFHYGAAANAAAVDFDDSAWQTVHLPHTWNREDAWDDEPGYKRGIGWYRRSLEIPPELAKRRLFLRFEAASQTAEVYVDGTHVASHVGGYTAFVADISDAIRERGGRHHVVAVKVSNAFDPDVPPLSADFTFAGGLYRDVWLIAMDDLHFDLCDHASAGIYVDTPEVSAESARVRVRGRVRCEEGAGAPPGGGGATATVRVEIRSPAGDTEIAGSSMVRLEPGAVTSFSLQLGPIDAPQLWSPASPALYSVCCTLAQNGGVCDEVTVPLGFRWFRFDADEGFFLNGRRLKLRGTNRHQDSAGHGVAVPDALHVRDVVLIKAMGANFLRLAHYPQDTAVLEACDRLGLIVWEEIPIVNYVTPSDAFRANCRQMLRDMVRQHYNHPSILMWGYMNEVFLYGPDGKYTRHIDDTAYAAWTVALARELDTLCRAEDSSRVTVMAGHGSGIYDEHGITEIPEVFGWNVYHGWYADHVAGLGGFLDRQHRDYPQRRLLVSEYGAGSDRRLHSLAPQRFDFTIEWQQHFHESAVKQFEARPYLAGYAIWNQFDFGVERRGDSIPHLNQKGVCYYDRAPKDVYHHYRAHWGDTPVTHIATRDWNQRAAFRGADGTLTPAKHPVWVYSNAAEVELFCGGTSLGKRKVGADRRVAWEVTLAAGQNDLRAAGTHDGRVIGDACPVHLDVCDVRTAKELAINVGVPVYYRAAGGRIWLPDRAYAKGAYGFSDGRAGPFQGNSNVVATDDDPLYQYHRVGLTGYRVDVPDGDYRVTLYCRSDERSAAKAALVRVTANGTPVVSHWALVAPQEGLCVVQRTFEIGVRSGSGLQLGFAAERGETRLSAILIQRSADHER